MDFQIQAIEAVCDLVRGQDVCRTEFTVMKAPTLPATDYLFPETVPQQLGFSLGESDLEIGNRLTVLDDEVLENLGSIQLRSGLRPKVWVEEVKKRDERTY